MISKKYYSILALALVLSFNALFAQEVTGEKISITVKEVTLQNVLRILSEKSGMSFISDPALRTKKISLDLKEVAPLEALSILTELYDLGFQQLSTPGKYVVANREDIEVPTRIATYHCQFSESNELAAAAKNFLTPKIGMIHGDIRTNTLIIQDTPGKVGELLHLISDLDKPTKQIYIKSAIAEISLSEDHQRGIQWFSSQSQSSGEKGIIGTDFGMRSSALTPFVLEEGIIPDINIAGGLGLGLITKDLDVVLNMLSETNDLTLLSTPYLLTLDNKWAEIEVGDQIPYQKLGEFGTVSYEFKNATIKLRIRAHVNNDSTITIEMEPQANFQQGFTPDGIPIISTRRALTQVTVKNGTTVILGGLMQESDVVSETKVPILGSIPIIGELFKFKQTTKKKTELIVMLTPQIVDLYTNSVSAEQMEQYPEKLKELITK